MGFLSAFSIITDIASLTGLINEEDIFVSN
jgi:hypothetical protein